MRSIGSARKDGVVWSSQGKTRLATTHDFVQWENRNLIVKLMAGVVNECVASEFACTFEEKLLLIGVFKSIRTVGQLDLEAFHANRRKWM
jgi:hypothetical protein